MTLQIRRMETSDLDAVIEIEESSQSFIWKRSMFTDELAQVDSRIYLVALENEVIVAFGGIMYAAQEAHITTISVSPTLRRKQLGQRLLLALIHQSISLGLKAMTLEVRISNDAARGLYSKFGFVPCGIRRAYYPDNLEDALVLWAYDIDGPDYQQRIRTLESAATT